MRQEPDDRRRQEAQKEEKQQMPVAAFKRISRQLLETLPIDPAHSENGTKLDDSTTPRTAAMVNSYTDTAKILHETLAHLPP